MFSRIAPKLLILLQKGAYMANSTYKKSKIFIELEVQDPVLHPGRPAMVLVTDKTLKLNFIVVNIHFSHHRQNFVKVLQPACKLFGFLLTTANHFWTLFWDHHINL